MVQAVGKAAHSLGLVAHLDLPLLFGAQGGLPTDALQRVLGVVWLLPIHQELHIMQHVHRAGKGEEELGGDGGSRPLLGLGFAVHRSLRGVGDAVEAGEIQVVEGQGDALSILVAHLQFDADVVVQGADGGRHQGSGRGYKVDLHRPLGDVLIDVFLDKVPLGRCVDLSP